MELNSAGSYVVTGSFPSDNYCGPLGMDPCETFYGSFTLTYTRVATSVALDPNLFVLSNTSTSVTTTARISPDTMITDTTDTVTGTPVVGTLKLPKDMYWYWRPRDSAGVNTVIPSCPYYVLTCTFTPSGSGKIWYAGVLNGKSDSASAEIYLRRCQLDSVVADTSPLDSVIVRDSLMSLVQEGKGLTTDTAGRKEFLMAFFLDSATQKIMAYPIHTDSANACASYWHPLDPAGFSGAKLLAVAHNHPWTVGNQPGSLCGWDPSYQVAPGGSKDDWKSINNLNSLSEYSSANWHPDFYVIDNENIYQMKHGGKYGDDKVPVMAWRQGACRW